MLEPTLLVDEDTATDDEYMGEVWFPHSFAHRYGGCGSDYERDDYDEYW